jgi:hypothetical protein
MRGDVKGVCGRKGVAGACGVSPAPSELVSPRLLTLGMVLVQLRGGSGNNQFRSVVTKR